MRRWRRPPATAWSSTPSTSTLAPAGWRTGWPGSSGRCRRRSTRSSGREPPGIPSARSTSAAGWVGPPAFDERPVDLDAYAAVLARHLGPLDVVIACEPGDLLSKDAGILLGEVVTVEERRGVTFVGLDLGWNVNNAYFIYKFAQEFVVCRAADAPRDRVVTVAGHINEASDVFAEDYPMAAVEEGDIVALLNGGGYHQAMSSTHCLRPLAGALYLDR